MRLGNEQHYDITELGDVGDGDTLLHQCEALVRCPFLLPDASGTVFGARKRIAAQAERS